MKMYDLFEEIVERSIDTMTTITVWIGPADGMLRMTVNTDSAAELSPLVSDSVSALRDEDGEWQLCMVLRAGGESE